MARFKYVSLQPRELRFLELHPGLPEDPLSGTIIHQHLSVEEHEIPQFEALSYHWGDQGDPTSISLSKCQSLETPSSNMESGSLDIGRNLASALRALRRQDKIRVLWCDSICINQQDLPERAAQVQRMKDIYRYAKSVVVWLGPETSWSTIAMETVRWAGEQIEITTVDYFHGNYCFKPKSTADQRILKTVDPLPLGGSQWLAIEQLVALDWHKRLWTLQEILLADQAACVVKLGKEEMPWAVYKDALIFTLYGKPLPPDCFLDKVSLGANADIIVWKALACLEALGKYNWIEMMSISGAYECSDPRDRVYALLGLVAPHFALSITPDYTKSAKDVLISICLQHIETVKNLDFLLHCNGATRPSWAADLDKPLCSLPIDCHAAPFSTPSAYLIEPGVLEVAGISCDELNCDPIPAPEKGISWTDFEYQQKVVDMVNAFTNHNPHQDDDHLDRLIMALTHGVVRDYSLEKLQIPNVASFQSLQDWRWKIRRWLSGTNDTIGDLEDVRLTDRYFISSLRTGSTAIGIAETKNRHFVRVHPQSRRGDIIAVFLGLKSPIVLRPQSTAGYLVIGTCYHPGLAYGNALLGDDLDGWEPIWDPHCYTTAFYKEGQPLRRIDPRLDNVTLEDGYVQNIGSSGLPRWGKVGSPLEAKDPRMSEEALKKRGAPVERFRLL